MVGENVESQRQQPVSRQDRSRLVERLVSGRAPSSKVVVVHRGQVVVDQRIAMHALDRRARAQRRHAIRAQRASRLNGEKRPQPLAAAERTVAHRVQDALRPHDLAGPRLFRQQRIERRLYVFGDFPEAECKVFAHA
jgi:hypothetical protein